MPPRLDRRAAGMLVPLFAIPSRRSWGIGEIGDILHIARWLAAGHERMLQLLPINEMAPGQHSPYSAISAMAIDPIFISIDDLPEFGALGGERALGRPLASALDTVRRAPRIDYRRVRSLKDEVLQAAFDQFADAEWKRHTPRADAFRAYCEDQRWWLGDYALFRAIHRARNETPWPRWEPALAERRSTGLGRLRRELQREILFCQYLQWAAHEQWQRARREAGSIAVFGDLPFMVDVDSADVWANQDQFRLEASTGVPPDAFSETGQNWGMPVYRWEQIAASGDRWLRERARRSADLYDGFRVDHLVGFYRTYAIPLDGSPPFFTPADETEQLAQGERVLAIFREPGSTVIAEDLGTVPTFVRESLARLQVPGFKVLRWEREWDEPGQPFRDPLAYPTISVATSGTHDTETLAAWWDNADAAERAEVAKIPSLKPFFAASTDVASDFSRMKFSASLRDALLETLFESGCDLLILPIQDVFGWRDRMNVPATVTDRNWTFRLPWPSDALLERPEARARADALRTWADRCGR